MRPVLQWMSRWAQGKFDRQPSWHAFVDWQRYYAAYLRTDPSHALLRHTGPHVGDPTHQNELVDGMEEGRSAAIVSAPPGCGKSRFALELARRIEQGHRRWQAVFVRHDEAAVREELHQLTQLKRVVFIIDDAHECPKLVELLAAECAQTSSLHLVCLTRSTCRAHVSRAINSAFPPGMIQEIDLGRPTPQLVRTLIDRLLPQSSPHHRDTIARFVRQSYFGAVLVCGMLSRETRLPQTFQRQDLRDRICREPLRGAADGVCPIEPAMRALAVYAALAPVSRARTDVREWAAQLSGLAPPTVDSLIDCALNAGLFHEHGHGLIRPMPDLLGDLILEAACADSLGKPTPFSTELLEQLLEAEPAATVRNCADIGQLFGTVQEADLISKLVLERAHTTPAGNRSHALKLLQLLQPLAAGRPATVIELAGIMESRGVLRRDPPAAGLVSNDSVEMGTFTLLMSAGEMDSTAVPVALALGRHLYAASRAEARSREHVLGELKTFCGFETGRSLAHAQAVANTLRAWVGESDIDSAALSASLSAQFLTLEVHSRHHEEETATPLRSPLSPFPEICAVRDVAVDTLARGIAHGDATVECTAIGSLVRYADCRSTPEHAWSDRWLPQLARELERLAAAVIKLANATVPLRVSATAEALGWHWWAQQHDALHRAGAAILRATPDTDAYRLWKFLFALPLPVRTALPESAPARSQDRLQFVQALSTVREEDTIEQARQLFDALDPRHPDIGAWRALWLAVLEQSHRMPIHPRADVLIGEFARRHAEVAWSFVNQADADGPLFKVLPLVLAALGKLDRARRSREAGNVPSGTRLEEAWWHALSLTSDFDEPERALLARGLESADSDTVHRAADALLAAGSADRLTAFRKVLRVIAHHATDSELWELALQRFVNWVEVVLPPRAGKPTDEMPQIANELITLLQTHGSQLRWGFQGHTRQLAKALAIIAVLCPKKLQDWMQRHWGQPEAPGGRWSDESPLSVSRLSEIMRLIADSPAATQWIETFLDWMKHKPQLGGIGALGLAELCSLDDTRVGELAQTIAKHPTDASQKAFADFVSQRKKREHR
jgi:hypothetical protein